jgi:hypothetical protein
MRTKNLFSKALCICLAILILCGSMAAAAKPPQVSMPPAPKSNPNP